MKPLCAISDLVLFVFFSPINWFWIQCRPPGIYKQDYLKELFARYGNVQDTPPAPDLPDWCFEEEDGVSDDDGGELAQSTDDPGRPAKKAKRRAYNEVKIFAWSKDS